MPLPEKFHQLDSRLDGFFAAECGYEDSGEPVSVLSALTRAGLDPWLEGARLAKLPTDLATRELAQLIAGFAPGNRLSPDVLRLSERLVRRLPKRGAAQLGGITAAWALCQSHAALARRAPFGRRGARLPRTFA